MAEVINEVVFLKFKSKERGEFYFAGTSEGILQDTNQGKSFGGEVFLDFKETSLEEIKINNFNFFEQALEEVSKGKTDCFFLGIKRN